MDTAESEARKALNRLRRAAEKAEREMEALEGALKHAEGSDFPADAYADVNRALRLVLDFTDEEAARLQEKILHAGGLEPGRVRRG
jgi:Cdc6-like AAA superfamily ATPase